MAFQYGEEQVAYAVAESTIGTAVVPAATDAFRVTTFDITPNYDRPEVPERTNTRSLQDRISGRKTCNFSISLVNRPSGTAGTPPDYTLLLKHAFGTYTNNSSTSDVYTLLKDPSALGLSVYRKLEGVLEGVYGGVIQNLTFSFSGDGFATIDISGVGYDMLWAGTDAANGAGSTATALIVDDGDFYGKYGVVQVGSNDNSGAGFQITAVSGQTLTLGAAASWSDDDAVIPFLPAATVGGNPLYGTAGSLSLDGGSSTISVISGSVSMSTGIGLFDRNFGAAIPSGVILPEGRSVTGSLSFLVDDNANYNILRGESANKTAQNIQLNIGTVAGSICRLAMPKAEIDTPSISSGDGLIECAMSFTALTSTATSKENEFTLTYM
jgi:hypothetical protein